MLRGSSQLQKFSTGELSPDTACSPRPRASPDFPGTAILKHAQCWQIWSVFTTMAHDWKKKMKKMLGGRSPSTGSQANPTQPDNVHSEASRKPVPATERIVPILSELETSESVPAPPDDLKVEERLWRQAYSDVEEKEPNLVKSFENSIRQQLSQDESTSTQDKPMAATTEGNPSPSQMQRLVHEGIERTKKSAKVKRHRA